eukprot:COSAG02_NODE_707_length_18254_cov_20.685872_12_plen_128_part_00
MSTKPVPEYYQHKYQDEILHKATIQSMLSATEVHQRRHRIGSREISEREHTTNHVGYHRIGLGGVKRYPSMCDTCTAETESSTLTVELADLPHIFLLPHVRKKCHNHYALARIGTTAVLDLAKGRLS